MYSREILPPRRTPIEDGAPVQGTWTKAFEEADLLGIQRPFSLPLPRWVRDLRIKEWESFSVQNDDFFLHALLFNFKYCRMAQVILSSKKAKEQMRIRKFIPLSGWRLPRSLANASIASQTRGFSFHIHDWLDADSVRVDLNIAARPKHPAFTAHLTYDLNRKRSIPLVVNLPFSERRCLYAFKSMAAVRGDIVFGGTHIPLNPARTAGIFCDFKGYYPYRMRSVWCNGIGLDGENRHLGFSIAENQAKEPYKNNENALWINGALTPLPPVRITVPSGPGEDWVIQDMEGMVDLTFTPYDPNRSIFDFIAARADYDTPLGYYNGALVNSKGDKFLVRNLWGLGEKLYLRV